MSNVSNLVSVALALSSDSFCAGLVLGPVVKTWPGRLRLAALFGVCGCAGSLLGAWFPGALPEMPAVLLYSFAVAAALLAARHSRTWLIATPIVLSLDNVVAGTLTHSALIIGMVSAGMAVLGMAASAAVFAIGRKLWEQAHATPHPLT